MAEDKKKKKNIFSRIIAWFKKTAEWIPEHLGDPAIARSIREDLGLKPGAQITPDSVVCIIEAMKVFNEIKAEKSGTLEQILVKNGEAVEFGQKLFALRP